MVIDLFFRSGGAETGPKEHEGRAVEIAYLAVAFWFIILLGAGKTCSHIVVIKKVALARSFRLQMTPDVAQSTQNISIRHGR
ncbi:unnamed protein product [Calypogeia fissa]